MVEKQFVADGQIAQADLLLAFPDARVVVDGKLAMAHVGGPDHVSFVILHQGKLAGQQKLAFVEFGRFEAVGELVAEQPGELIDPGELVHDHGGLGERALIVLVEEEASNGSQAAYPRDLPRR